MQAFINVPLDDGSEITISIDYAYHHQDANISGAWGDSSPEEESFEWEHNESHWGYNAQEWLAIQNITEDTAFQACMDAIELERNWR